MVNFHSLGEISTTQRRREVTQDRAGKKGKILSQHFGEGKFERKEADLEKKSGRRRASRW